MLSRYLPGLCIDGIAVKFVFVFKGSGPYREKYIFIGHIIVSCIDRSDLLLISADISAYGPFNAYTHFGFGKLKSIVKAYGVLFRFKTAQVTFIKGFEFCCIPGSQGIYDDSGNGMCCTDRHIVKYHPYPAAYRCPAYTRFLCAYISLPAVLYYCSCYRDIIGISSLSGIVCRSITVIGPVRQIIPLQFFIVSEIFTQSRRGEPQRTYPFSEILFCFFLGQ